MKNLLLFFLVLLTISCAEQEKPTTDAAEIVAKCIQKHGGNSYKKMDVSFHFRQYKIHLQQNDSGFMYERFFTDSLDSYVGDRIVNDTFTRTVNDRPVTLSPEEQAIYRENLNAVAYFALLPYKLSEPAVNLVYLGTASIDSVAYDKIGVTFKQEGGANNKGQFTFWINQKTNTLDYLAFSNDGPRFRKATKRTKVDGVIFQDYENYTLADTTLKTSDYDVAYKNGKATLLSRIRLEMFKSNKPRN